MGAPRIHLRRATEKYGLLFELQTQHYLSGWFCFNNLYDGHSYETIMQKKKRKRKIFTWPSSGSAPSG